VPAYVAVWKTWGGETFSRTSYFGCLSGHGVESPSNPDSAVSDTGGFNEEPLPSVLEKPEDIEKVGGYTSVGGCLAEQEAKP